MFDLCFVMKRMAKSSRAPHGSLAWIGMKCNVMHNHGGLHSIRHIALLDWWHHTFHCSDGSSGVDSKSIEIPESVALTLHYSHKMCETYIFHSTRRPLEMFLYHDKFAFHFGDLVTIVTIYVRTFREMINVMIFFHFSFIYDYIYTIERTLTSTIKRDFLPGFSFQFFWFLNLSRTRCWHWQDYSVAADASAL